MVKLHEIKSGYYLFELDFAGVKITKALKDSDISVDDLQAVEPQKDGFYFCLPDDCITIKK